MYCIERFWATVCKTLRPIVIRPLSVLSVCHVLSVLCILSVCDVGVLWPNGWTDQDETWHAGWPHCVNWGPSSFKKGTAPQFSAHVRCGQTTGWIKMPVGIEVGLDRGDFVLDGDPVPPRAKGAQQPPSFRPMPIVASGHCRPSQLLLSCCLKYCAIYSRRASGRF